MGKRLLPVSWEPSSYVPKKQIPAFFQSYRQKTATPTRTPMTQPLQKQKFFHVSPQSSPRSLFRSASQVVDL